MPTVTDRGLAAFIEVSVGFLADKWLWGRYYSSTLAFPCHLSFHLCSINAYSALGR